MILKLGMYHLGLKLYKVYINDNPGLNLTYFTARSYWVTCTFERGLNNTVNETDMTPGGCLPLPQDCIHVHNHYFQTSLFSETAWPINAKFHVESFWEAGKKVYINGTGHMTRMAAMLIYGKNLKNLLLQN